jgi:uroporphyrinogen decarboxylase
MRQAGRVLPEYRTLRERWSLIEISANPELAVTVALQPLRRMPLDAAIVFADIMTPLIGIGIPIAITDGIGPVIESPIATVDDVDAIRSLEPAADVPHVLEAIRVLRSELPPEQAVIGFGGAPFTLASYLIEGRSSRDFVRTKSLMYGAPVVWHELMERLTDLTIRYLAAQISAGADVVQLFDSWVGALSPDDYERYVRPYTRRIFGALSDTAVPTIHFGVDTAGLLDQIREDGATVIGLDWRIPLDVSWARLGDELAVQGNLDPAALFAPVGVLEGKALDVLDQAGARTGHIFNLGHGLLPGTPLDNVIRLVDFVRERSAQLRAELDPVG